MRHTKTSKTITIKKLDSVFLQVNDLEISKAFYTDKLGFELSALSNAKGCIFQFNKGKASFAIRKPPVHLKELGIRSSL